MTPNEIYNTRFDKAAVGGYKAEDVNRFVIAVGDYIKELEAERNDLEDKLEILAEKLEEYRADEESLRSAILGAQKMGDSVVRESRQKSDIMLTEAKSKSDEMLAEARYKAEVMLDDARRSIETEEYALEKIKASVVKFKRKVMSMYEQQVRLIQQIPFDESGVELEPARPAFMNRTPEPVEYKAEEAEQTEQLEYEEEYSEEVMEEVQEERATTRFKDENLKSWFGEDHSLTRKD